MAFLNFVHLARYRSRRSDEKQQSSSAEAWGGDDKVDKSEDSQIENVSVRDKIEDGGIGLLNKFGMKKVSQTRFLQEHGLAQN